MSSSLEAQVGHISPPLPCLRLRLLHRFTRFNAKPCSRGYVLSPGDSPLLPGECIEGTVGVRRLGFLPGFSWKPRLSVGPGGDTILSRADGTEVRPHIVPAKCIPCHLVPPPRAVFDVLFRGIPSVE